MMYYEKPMLVIISFNTADMITTSLGDDNGLIQDGGGWNIGGKNGANGFEFESF